MTNAQVQHIAATHRAVLNLIAFSMRDTRITYFWGVEFREPE